MEDLTLGSFAYLRLPLVLAAIAFAVGAVGNFLYRGRRAFLASALMMILFFQAARLALVVFDPFMSSRPLAAALLRSPQGNLIVDYHYYKFSSVFFYTNRTALLLNGKRQNLVYGASAPGAPEVFIDDAQFAKLWAQPQRWYIVADDSERPRFKKLVGDANLNLIAASGGKFLVTNHPIDVRRNRPQACNAPGYAYRMASGTSDRILRTTVLLLGFVSQCFAAQGTSATESRTLGAAGRQRDHHP